MLISWRVMTLVESPIVWSFVWLRDLLRGWAMAPWHFFHVDKGSVGNPHLFWGFFRRNEDFCNANLKDHWQNKGRDDDI